MLAVGPADAADTLDRRPMAAETFFLHLAGDMPGANSRWRVSVVRCKPCFNPHDVDDLPKYLPVALTRYVLNNVFAVKPHPYHVTDGDVSVPVESLGATQISVHHTVRVGTRSRWYSRGVERNALERHPRFVTGNRNGPAALLSPAFAVLG